MKFDGNGKENNKKEKTEKGQPSTMVPSPLLKGK